ncbi:MAG: xanthine dehydrogenase family protein molybdopterin-binding subunit [Hyphomicrobiaceae bacterium]
MIDFRKDIFSDERDDNLNEIGKPTQRQDMLGHVTGRTKYFDDHLVANPLHLKAVRSPHHHARIRSIDTSAAERLPGVRCILRGGDVPVNINTLLSLLQFGIDDEPSLAVDKVRYVGEPVAAIIAESEPEALAAVSRVRVEYEPLPAVFDVEEALGSGAPEVNPAYPGNAFIYHEKYNHQRLRFGDVAQGFSIADHVLEERYQMSPIEHAPTETNGCVAAPENDGRYICYTCTQALFFSLDTAAKILDVPSNKLHFVGGTVGGGFGGKVDTLTEPLAVLGAMKTGRAVRYVFNRQEEMQVGSPRGAERIYIKDGVMNDGRIVARQMRVYIDAGAYTRLSSYAGHKCTAHLPGPYTIPHVHTDVYCVYTNRTPSTAMRGFGVTGVDFALEVQMDKLARLLGMDPIEFRLLNAYRDGDMKAHRREAKNCALIECCQVAAEKTNWPIREAFKQMSSRKSGGAQRVESLANPSSILSNTPQASQPLAEEKLAMGAAPSTTQRAAGSALHATVVPSPHTETSRANAVTANDGVGSARFSSIFGKRRR